MQTTKSVDQIIEGKKEWSAALRMLRSIILSHPVKEVVKWGMPVYTVEGKNIVGIGAFKAWCGIWFFQGAFLKDKHKKLINAQEGKTKGMRQWRFFSSHEVEENRGRIMAYIEEAITNHHAGKEIKPEKSKPLELPIELTDAFRADPVLADHFERLSTSRRREYAEHVAEAKKSETRLKRLEKVRPMIMEGKGLNDKYRR